MKSLELISLFEKMYTEKWKYEYGAAREGCVDCSGAFTYAFKKFGQDIAHGSNTIARKHISGSIHPASEARPGWAVFKWKEANSDMPAAYINDGKGDFYHIGLLSLNNKDVLNAKGTQSGFCVDSLSKWAYAAPLKGVDYSDQEGEEPMEALYKAVVNTARDPLRVRDKPETGYICGHVPRGKTVEVLNVDNPSWPYIRYNEVEGYASGVYLTKINDYTAPSTNSNGYVTVSREVLTGIRDKLNAILSAN